MSTWEFIFKSLAVDFYSQINKGHLKKAGGYSSQNVALLNITKILALKAKNRTTTTIITRKSRPRGT